MKVLSLVAVAAISLVIQAAPAFALEKTMPTITLVPLTTAPVAVRGPASCNAPAAVNSLPFFEMPEIASGEGIHGTSSVRIDLTSSGSLAREALFTSSGNVWLDDAAMRSARLTRFTAELVDCKYVAGTYLYEVEY